MGRPILCQGLEKAVTLRILSWNILQGGGRRVHDIVSTLSSYDCDLIVLQEFRHGKTRDIIIDGLAKMGLVHVYSPEPDSTSANTVLIASKTEITGELLLPEGKNSVPAALCLSATIRVGEESDLTIIGVHLPHKKQQLPYFETLRQLPDALKHGSSMIIGDFNCGIPFEDSETKTFYATHQFQALLKNDWIDLWRVRNPQTREFSWISTRKGNGFRYDHALGSATMNEHVTAIRYDHTPRLKGISDHSVLLVNIDFKR